MASRGAERLVYEAALKVAVLGARPLALVDNLNFGNPEKPHVMWQFTEALAGLGAACEALGVPIVGGNVSFYNETEGRDIYPTPVVGMLGLAEPVPARPGPISADMRILLIGPRQSDNLAGTAYQKIVQGTLAGRPTPIDPEAGGRSIELALRLAHVVPSAVLHDVSQGGALLALTELLIGDEIGATLEPTSNRDAFGEDPHRFLCLVPAVDKPKVLQLAAEVGCAVAQIGITGGSALSVANRDVGDLAIERIRSIWRGAIPNRMHGAIHE